MTPAIAEQSLRELASLCGVQLGYTAGDGRRVTARSGSLVAILNALGHPVSDAASIDVELDQARQARATRTLEPVVVAAADGGTSTPIVLDQTQDPDQVSVTLALESGETREGSLSALVSSVETVGDPDRLAYAIDLSGMGLPPGYHQLHLAGPGLDAAAFLLVPPRGRRVRRRDFGVVAPLYAIRGDADWGVGNLSDLAAFAEWIGGLGGTFAGTLPIFAGNLREPVDPSPYLPYSRLFWNELFVDVTALPEVPLAAAELIDSAGFQRELEKAAADPTVDYATVMDRKREVMMVCAAELMRSEGARRADYESFVAASPEVSAYAAFRAADDRATNRWRWWPSPPGRLPAAAIDPQLVDYHRYVQFVVAEQLGAAASAGAGLYLDLPVGVHGDGYDTWAYTDLFAEAGVGAPPDPLAPQGQSWGFPPLHPDRLRESGYDYLIRSLREVLRFAGAIRIDHVLGLHRMFWIPSGGSAVDGAYVRYHHEELRAVISIEADRAGTVVVGEDLGTVTPGIRQAMDRDGMLHSFVTRFEATADDPLPQPRRPSAASVGSHDLPKFATYWREHGPEGDADPRVGMDAEAALTASLYSLAAGPADLVLADLGDLLGQQVPDNQPGTGPEAGNWRHRLPMSLEQIADDPAVTTVLAGIRDRREGDS